MKKHQILQFIFFSAVFIVSILYKPYPFSWLVKIIPMGILISCSYQLMKTKSERLFIIGLIFSMGGDFFLDYDRVNWFVFGLVSFLIAQLFYMFSFKPIEKKNIVAVVCYGIYGLVIFSVISPGLNELFLPVLGYMSVLMLMGVFTLVSKKSNFWLIIGGISFIISDSIIAVDKFYEPIPYSHYFIMITYYFAQFSLVTGVFQKRNQ